MYLNHPEMIMSPISKVVVLVLNRTKKVCLLERGFQTKGIWSLFEKDIKTDVSMQGLVINPWHFLSL